MARTLASLAFLVHVFSLANGNGMCQGTAECDSGDDTSSAFLQLQQAAPVSRGPLQQRSEEGLQQRADDAIPNIDCKPKNGTCWAQKTACELMGMMKEWDTSNKAIVKVKDQLKGLCYNGATGTNTKVGTEATGTTAEVGLEQLECYGKRYFTCATDVAEYYKKHPGAEYGMKAGKAGAQAAVATMSLVLKDAGKIALKGSVVFAVVGAIISNFFPGGSGPPANPCTYAGTEWAQCVWQQVAPLVANFVGQEIEGVFDELWRDHLEGYKALLWEINETTHGNSDLYPNGTIKNMSDEVRDRMFSRLSELNDMMLAGAPSFTDDEHGTTDAGIYLSMFSSLHISVMTSVFASRKYRTAGDRGAFQTLILCYAKKVLARALKARNRRLSLVARKVHGFPTRCRPCMAWGDIRYKCCGDMVTYQDQAQNCHWSESCGPQAFCAPGESHYCTYGPACKKSKAENAYNCHRAFVQKQSDEMWQQWLAPIPAWIETVARMQKAKLSRERGRRARRGGKSRTTSEFENYDMTCPF